MAARTRSPSSRCLTWLGAALTAAAVLALLYELSAALQAGEWRIVPAGEIWFTLHTASLNLVQAIVQRYLHPFLWDPVIAGFLQWPLWASFGGPGIALLTIFGSRRAR
ncbi:MAG: hypothetical protein OYH76_14225 [Defluviicoccus sp.]|nr:hypothetical protein [Defluviicoccus sp.]MDE0277047.1 hypothetical protein [Defluviicoccus sp.]